MIPTKTFQSFAFMPWWGACCHGWVLWFSMLLVGLRVGVVVLVLGISRRSVTRVYSWHSIQKMSHTQRHRQRYIYNMVLLLLLFGRRVRPSLRLLCNCSRSWCRGKRKASEEAEEECPRRICRRKWEKEGYNPPHLCPKSCR